MKKLALLLAVVMVICSFGAVTVFAAGAGVEGDPYLITTPEELLAMSENKNAHYKLANNINLAGYTWTPFDFNGYLDGDNKEIENLTLDSTSGTVGMFTYMRGTVENLIIKSGSVKTTGNNVGSIAGEAQGGAVIRNVTNYASVTGNQTVGGIVGIGNNVLIENCVNHGDVTATTTGESNAGGIISYNYEKTTVNNCINNGALSGTSYVGGIVAKDRKELVVTGCTNNGNLTVTKSNNGGIATVISETSSIDNCINYGDIATGETNNGGIVGTTSGSVTNCTNYGDVTQTSWTAAGIASAFSMGILNNCENYGTITSGQNNTAGIVGQAGAGLEITDCKNYGTIYGNWEHTGGIVGQISTGLVADCYNEGAVDGQRYVGGIIGTANRSEINNCQNSGTVTCSSMYLGGIVGNSAGTEEVPATITGCTNDGFIICTRTSTKDTVGTGGIAGQISYTTLSDSSNSKLITAGTSSAGGIVGMVNAGATVIDCVNTGAVEGDSKLGGIAGSVIVDTGLVTKCVNSGNITGTGSQIGGVVGTSSAAITSYCGNTGTVSTVGGNQGGILGQMVGANVLTDCYNVSESASAGGLVGAIETADATVTNCYAYGAGSGAMYNWKKGAITYENNYYYGTFSKANEATAMTADEFADGTVVALLNGDRTGSDAVWTQGEGYPVIGVSEDDGEEPVVTSAEITEITDTTVAYAVTLADEDEAAVVIIALYNGDQLFAVKTVSADETSAEFTTTVGATNAKIFVWENFTTLKPIVMDEYGL